MPVHTLKMMSKVNISMIYSDSDGYYEDEYLGDFDEFEEELLDDPNIEVVKILKGSGNKNSYEYQYTNKQLNINSYDVNTQNKDPSEKIYNPSQEVVQEDQRKEPSINKEHKKNKLDDLFSENNKNSDPKNKNSTKSNEKSSKQISNKKNSDTKQVTNELNNKTSVIQDFGEKSEAKEKVVSDNRDKSVNEKSQPNIVEIIATNNMIEETSQVLNELDINKNKTEINLNEIHQERNQYPNKNFQNRNHKSQNYKYNKHQNYNENTNYNQINYQNTQRNFNHGNNFTDFNNNDSSYKFNNNQVYDNNNNKNRNHFLQTLNKYDINLDKNTRNVNSNNFDGQFPIYNNHINSNYNYRDNNQVNNFPQMQYYNYQQFQGYYNPAMMMQQFYPNNPEQPNLAYAFPNQNVNENPEMTINIQNYQKNQNRNYN